MPSFFSASRAIRCSLIAAATLLFVSASAQGQGAAPQLLPYTVTAIAGNAPTTPAVVLPTYPGTCPSGRTATNAVGDGCLATEVTLNNPRFVTEDAQGNIYFSDSINSRIRRIEMNNQATLGVISTYAGGATTQPVSVATCNPAGTPITDTIGDGNLATSLLLKNPSGLVFDTTGNLYFADSGNDTVRKIDATTKIVTLVAGNCAGSFGYAANSTTPAVTINAATQSYLNFPYGLSLDSKGGLFIANEGAQALVVVNLNTTGSITENGVAVPAGTISKIAGYGVGSPTKSATNPLSPTDCPNYPANAASGCYFAPSNALVSGFTGPAISTNLDNPFDVAVDGAGNVYFSNVFPYQMGLVTNAGVISQYAGTSNTKYSGGLKRGAAQSVSLAANYGMSIDKGLYPTTPNLYIADATDGFIWRVDGTSKTIYQVGGASGPCTNATDTVGDGCPANNATFSLYLSTSVYGIFGLFADNYSNLLVADARNNLIREVSSGAQFGLINGSHPVNTLQVHFDKGDTFSSSVSAATITAGSTNFTVGTFSAANCTTNSDTTVDCQLTLQANPTTLGAFTGTLQITSSLGKTNTFPLSGFYVNVISPTTTTTSLSAGGCTVTTGTGTANATTITAKVRGQINGTATGSVKFFVDGTQVGTGTLASNIASFAYTFPAGSHTYYATYAGDSNFSASTSTTGNVTASAPTFTMAPACKTGTTTTCTTGTVPTTATIAAGATALYAFNVTPVAYNGTVSFSCSGLPAGAHCTFYPGDPTLASNTFTVTQCGGPYVVALSISTQPNLPVAYGFGAYGKGKWAVLGMLPALLLALFVMIRRRKSTLRYSAVVLALAFLVAMASAAGCGNDLGPKAQGTPSGTSTVTVTGVTGSGLSQTQTVTLTVQ